MTVSVPLVIGETQPIIRIVEVLPAPFGPRNPNDSPRATSKSMASTAVKPPNRLVRPRAWMSEGSGISCMGGECYRNESTFRPTSHPAASPAVLAHRPPGSPVPENVLRCGSKQLFEEPFMAAMPSPVAELLEAALVGELTVIDAGERPVTYPLIPLWDGERVYL